MWFLYFDWCFMYVYVWMTSDYYQYIFIKNWFVTWWTKDNYSVQFKLSCFKIFVRDFTTRWHCDITGHTESIQISKLQRWMHYMWREYQWIRVVTQAFIIDLWCQKQTLTLYTATSVTQTQWCPAADKKMSPCSTGDEGKRSGGLTLVPK